MYFCLHILETTERRWWYFTKNKCPIIGEDGSSNKGSSISLRAQDCNVLKAPSSVPSEASIVDGEAETEQDSADVNQSEEALTLPSPPLSPAASDIISEPQSTLVNQSQESAWREVTVSGGEWGNIILMCY